MLARDLKWGMSVCCFEDVSRETMEMLADVGASVLEISLKPSNLARLDFAQAAKDAAASGIVLWSLHLPFYPNTVVNPASLDAGVRENTLKTHGEYIKKAAAAGVSVAVVHPSNGPIDDRDASMCYAKEVLAELADTAAHAGITLAVENMTRTGLGCRSCELLDLLSADDRLRVCFDSNHPLLENPCDYFHAVAERVVTLHLSDYDGLNERHWLPGTGIIDWKRLVTELEAANYAGPWMYEIDLVENENLSHPPIALSQVRDNRDALTSRLPTRPIGVINRENCMKNSFYPEVQYG